MWGAFPWLRYGASGKSAVILCFQHPQDGCLGSCAGGFAHHLAALHDHQGGNAHDAELTRQLHLFIHVDLPDFESGRSSAISSTIGTTIRQGPHHGAQKSRRTFLSEFNTSFWKLFLLILIADIFTSSLFSLWLHYITAFDIVLWWYHISCFLHPVLCLILCVVLCINRYQFSHIASHLRYKVPRKRYGYLYDLKNTWACQRKDHRRYLLTSVSATSEGVPW